MQKTNAMRALDTAKINYRVQSYPVDESDLSGVHAAESLGVSPDVVFKTIVARAGIQEYRVFCIPVGDELDLKKCAVVSGDKRLELLHVKELLPTTGYIRGGCSPIGMKKKFPTYIDETAILFDEIYLSAGVRGTQIIINPQDLVTFLDSSFHDLVK
ncbi:MAG: Cys-tRNA(Pro) deacylase [Clostridia bacterium]|nr:Cys-tRNA(Pro) deacylase [Clostridia bacterium]